MKITLLVSALMGLLFAYSPSASAHSCGAQLATKQAAVDRACKPQSKYTCPSAAHKTCAQWTTLFNAARTCKAARTAVNGCYNPPDQGHRTAAQLVGQQVIACQTKMQTQCAAERRSAKKGKK